MSVIFLGAAGIFNAVFLPGYLLLRLLGLASFSGTIILAFGFSLVINYAAGTLLTALGIFNRTAVLSLFGAELLILLWLLLPVLKRRVDEIINLMAAQEFLRELGKDKTFAVAACDYLMAFAALFTVAVFIHISVTSVAEGFKGWDVVNVFVIWADMWFRGIVPDARSYPQLIPVNWAMIYQFCGSSVFQVFPRLLSGLFPTYLIGCFVFLWIFRRQAQYLYAVVFCGLILRFYALGILTSGHLDVPVAFFCVASFCFLLAAIHSHDDGRLRLLIAGFVLATGAALTKQSGLLVVLFYYVFALVLLRREVRSMRKVAAGFAAMALIGAALLLPWYLPRSFSAGNLELIAVAAAGINVHEGLPLWARLADSIRQYLNNVTRGLLLVSLFVRESYWSTVLWGFCVPWFFLSLTFLGHDARNFTLAVPLFGACAGMAIRSGVEFTARYGPNSILPRLRVGWFGAFAILAAAAMVYDNRAKITDSRLEARDILKQMEIGYPEANKHLYALLEEKDGTFFGNYMFMRSLPRLKDAFWFDHLIDDPALVECTLFQSGSRYFVVLETRHSDPIVQHLQARGKLRLLFDGDVKIYEVVSNEPPPNCS